MARLGALLFAAFLAIQTVQSFSLPSFNLAALVGFHHLEDVFSASGEQHVFMSDEDLKRTSGSSGTQYLLGVGKADITGPVAELEFMGYADLGQIGTGLRQRLYARSFIIGDPNNENDRVVYIVLDTQSGDTAIRYGILDGIAALGSDYAKYSQSNVALTGTHSHSGPAAWLNYLLPQITSKGFSPQSYEAIVNGTVLSVKRAHESLTTGTLSYGTVDILDANINRSPYAYEANPAQEKADFDYNVDKFMSVLKFTRADTGKDMGILTWFPVHGTSMLGNNTLASGDNKGVAADLFEKYITGSTTATQDFVAGFSQANVGDTSPRIEGAWCEDGTNVMCTYEQSLCSGVAENCYGRGPNFTVKDNGATDCYTMGSRQFEAAQSQYESTNWTPITGSAVRSYHTFQNMTYFNFALPNGTQVQTCAASLGYSFAAGTTDWPGFFDFKQNENDTDPNINPVWSVVGGLLHEPSEEQRACQDPKPILLDVGNTHAPYDWAPDIADIQSFRVGQMFFIISPGEATTMSGRRWKKAVIDAALASNITGSAEPIAVLGGPANSYTHYIATPEEYGVQRYEGASTLFGPWTLPAYINLSTKYLSYLAEKPPAVALDAGPSPPNNVGKSFDFITGVVFDAPTLGKSFGDIITDAPTSVKKGETVNATFVGADPRNNLKQEANYATVEMQNSDGTWKTVRDDSSWDLVYNWARTSTLLGTSQVTINWIMGDVGTPVQSGTYRLRYFGDSKALLGGAITSFEGTSGPFTVS